MKELSSNETLIYETKPHWIVFAPAIFWLALTLVVLIFGSSINSIGHLRILNFPPLYKMVAGLCFVVSFFYASGAYVQREFSRYIITTRRVLVKSGMTHRKTTEIMAPKIEGIHVIQPIWGRLFNYGTVIVIGIGGSQDPFVYIPNPEEFRKKIQTLGYAS